MAYSVQVEGMFTFTDDVTLLEIGGMKLDLSKIETIDEWRMVLYGIAVHSLEQITKAAPVKTPSLRKPFPSSKPASSNAEAMTDLEEQFRRQRESLAQQTNKLREDITTQYRELSEAYEGALDAAGIRKPTGDGSAIKA